jgi:hypothetical protein
LAYLAFALDRLGPNLAEIGRELAGDGVIGIGLIVVLMVIAAMRREHWPMLFVATGYLTILGLFNDLAGPRHRDAVLVVLVVMAGRWLASLIPATRVMGWRAGIASVAAVLACVLLTFQTARGIYWMRLSRENQYYSRVAAELAHQTPRSASIMSNYPTMIGCLTGARSVGGCWLVENLPETARRLAPDTILIDNGPIEQSYAEFQRHPLVPDGYRVAVHDVKGQYILLTRQSPVLAMQHEPD